jgi:hypothetical protein
MADNLPPLPLGAEIMPPLPAGAELSSGGGPKPAAPNPEPALLHHPLMYAEHEISAPVESAWNKLKTDWQAITPPDLKKYQTESFWDTLKDQYRSNVAAGKVPIDAFNLVVAPLAGAIHGAVIKPAAEGLSYGLNEILPGFVTEQEAEKGIGEATLALGPEAEGVSGAVNASRMGALETALKAPKGVPAPTAAQAGIPSDSMIGKAVDKSAAPKELPKPSGPYAEAVKKLQAEGVDLTLGQSHGGIVRRAEEAHKSNPLTGTAIREAENRSIQTFNKAGYNRVLANIGEKFDGNEIGRAGVKQVGDKLDRAYEAIKPKLKLTPDDQLLTDMANTRTEVSEMPEAQEKQFETIINNRFLKRVGQDGTIDGATFKQIESELTYLASTYKSSADAAHRELGGALSDVVTALRENLERSSDPSVREELKKINTGWAMLTRLESAASRRAGSGGVFTTGDLLQAVKSGDRSARKRTFARGDALMQDFAETAHTVLPDRLPDSGTTERQMWNNLTGIILKGAGIATNPLYRRAAEAMTKRYVPPPAP